MTKNTKNIFSYGFTIVELMVVVVVIAILAMISLVTYAGVTDRANNDQTITAVASYIKALRLYAADNGQLPIDTAWPCLGDTTQHCGITPSSPGCWGTGYVTGDATFKAAILSEVTTLPNLSTQVITCNGASSATGGFYYSANGLSAAIYYFLKGTNVDCGSPAGVTATVHNTSGNATECGIPLTNK